ncbi:MAG TPA: hypothetical protein PK054_04920 [Anaerohalosphaeraceae bacterium]|nr:hypothetical protein [Anaerohalosphaeraceae bacterium]HOL89860.1 hypothetical protein [Anaerohalosphaeraceae bacterium]HPP55907.1 hypothetical protein [Anaerohalosphaeraceae bacterium]
MDFILSPKQPAYRKGFLWLLIFISLFVISLLCFAAGRLFEILSFLVLPSVFLFLITASVGVIAVLLYLNDIAQCLHAVIEKMEQTLESLGRQQTLLVKISQAVRVSDRAKEIIFRDAEQIELGEAVLSKVHQHDFEAAEAMLDEMAKEARYKELESRLRQMAVKYRTATEEGRINQIINHINDLLERHLWAQAAAQIENLLTLYSFSEKARQMPAKLQEKKNQYKRKLLAEWDKAVKNKETDRSLEILKELDMYLTPAEALALQESASTVFKTKLHNLGVEFQMAVTEKNWKAALHAARQIVQHFPNSRMAAEIRGKMDILQERARQTASEGTAS